MRFRKPKPKTTLEEFFKLNFEENNLWEYKAEDVELLAELVDIIRPKYPDAIITVDICDLIKLLRENENYANGFSKYLMSRLNPFLTW